MVHRRRARILPAAGPAVIPVTGPRAPSSASPSSAVNPIALRGPARPERYMEASGHKAAVLGREDGSFEAWVYPMKVLHDFRLSFGVAAGVTSSACSSRSRSR
jgi:hypothetical protein